MLATKLKKLRNMVSEVKEVREVILAFWDEMRTISFQYAPHFSIPGADFYARDGEMYYLGHALGEGCPTRALEDSISIMEEVIDTLIATIAASYRYPPQLSHLKAALRQ